LEINIGRSVIPNQPKPEKFDLLKAITKGSRVDLDWLRDNPGGHIFEEVVSEVQPAPEGAVSKLKLYPDGVEQEFAELRAEPGLNADFPHLLIGFRSKYVLNSFGHNLPALKKKSGTTNPAHLHPADLAALGIEEDDEVQIASSHGQISAIVKADAKIKPGVIAMHHCWGLSPDKQGSVRENGANTNLLVSSETDTQRYTGMTRSSSIPVRIKKSA
jgi:anaerobic selenocysteine-containing dehydrogenase